MNVSKILRVDIKDLPKHKTPLFNYCRKLLKAGTSPKTKIQFYRDKVLCMSMPVGKGAELTVVEPDDRKGCRPLYFRKYEKMPDKLKKRSEIKGQNTVPG